MIKCIALVCVIVFAAASSIWAIGPLSFCAFERPATHPVAGKLYVNGVAVSNATIVFHPIAAHSAEIYRPVASSKSDGSFALMTFAPDDGAPEGEYVVTVLWIDPTQPYDECGDVTIHDVLKGRYFDATKSTLRAHVVAGSNEIEIFAENPGGWSNVRNRDLEPVHPKRP